MTLPLFTRALARTPAKSIAEGLTTQQIGTPDIQRTLQQYHGYLDALRQCGLQVDVLPADEHFPDGHYVEDAAIVYRDMAFITRPGAPERAGEPLAIAENLRHLRQIHIQGDDAVLDGGDVLFCADRVLIGIGTRTNAAGAHQLTQALHTVDSQLRVDCVPFQGVLHLKTGLTELAPNVLVYHPAMQIDYALDFAEVIELPLEEGYAANTLPINGTLLIPAGFPTILREAERHYTHIIRLEMDEFQKMDGSLTCLSLRY